MELNAPAVIPPAFPRWEATMDRWGSLMLASVSSCAEMASIGFGMPRDAISSLMRHGPHLLAPTGSDLSRFCEVGRPLAGWHNDLNLLTIHGKARYSGLSAWLRDGTKLRVSVPRGCLLVQAGQQLEHLTAGAVQAGMHEVVVTQAALARAQDARNANRPPWRVSSTLFAHIASDQTLTPLAPVFASKESQAAYPSTTAGEQVLGILQKIALSKPPSSAA